MKRKLARFALFVVALWMVASALTVPHKSDKFGDPLLQGARVDPEVLSILQQSCLDCHSEATYYPWYSYIAPVSLVIKDDVDRGRTHLNLSRWNEYSLIQKERSLSEIANQVEDGEMPLRQYTLIHSAAKLSENDVKIIFDWTQKERARLIAESSSK